MTLTLTALVALFLQLRQLLGGQDLHRLLAELRVEDRQFRFGRGHFLALGANRAFVDRVGVDQRAHALPRGAELVDRRLELSLARVANFSQLCPLIVAQTEVPEFRSAESGAAHAEARSALAAGAAHARTFAALLLLRLILRERITLQGSMSYLAFVVVIGAMAVFPDQAGQLAHALGFYSLANFFFCTCIAALAILHLRALVTLSRVHLRTIVLTQEVAILQEKLERSQSNKD